MEENENNSLEFNSRLDLSPLQNAVDQVKNELGKVIIGQEDMIEDLALDMARAKEVV